MKQLIIKTKNGNQNIIKNLRMIGTEQRENGPGYVLIYSDDNNRKSIIYQSGDREYLKMLQCKIWDAYREDKKEINI